MSSACQVYLYAPNIIGYVRVFMALAAFSLAFTDFKLFIVLYATSMLLDAVDGMVARRYDQASKFGALLDMVTDRCSSNGLLMILGHIYPKYFLVFLGLALLDYSSHWASMYAAANCGAESHKKIGPGRPSILRWYYHNKAALFSLCVCQEAALIGLYGLHFAKIQGPVWLATFGYINITKLDHSYQATMW
jgi:CDP-diacylglycerol--inositol 3-phosphatidyltransferase